MELGTPRRAEIDGEGEIGKGGFLGLRTFRIALGATRLHRDVPIQVGEGSVGLLAAVPTALVYALDLLVPSARALVLLGAGDGDE